MFQPETEDMLPRAAPTPSATSHAGVKPMVPEVSILFGQQSGSIATTTQMLPVKPVAHQTYAAWKKQVLPKVTFPPDLTNNNNGTPTAEYVPTPRSNLYPLRASVSPLVTASSNAECLPYQRRSSEGTTTHLYATTPHDYGYPSSNAGFQQQQRRSLGTVAQQRPISNASDHDVLTICAGTQTDAGSPDAAAQSQRNFATKQDVQQLLLMLQDMRAEQLRLTQLCEAVLVRQRDEDEPKRTFLRDIGTQYETGLPHFAPAKAQPLMHDYIGAQEVVSKQNQQQQQAVPSNAYNQQKQHLQFQSPRGVTPIAQSTVYRANTPRSQRPAFVHQQQHNIVKHLTEQSMAMNELALKYLPNEKLGEMLQELHMSPGSGNEQAAVRSAQQQPTTPPLRQIENFEKCANDISNASYKYLKKYRLLPEDGGGDYHQLSSPRTQSPAARQQQSPYQQQLTGTPLSRDARGSQEQLLDLDHLRNQPKFV